MPDAQTTIKTDAKAFIRSLYPWLDFGAIYRNVLSHIETTNWYNITVSRTDLINLMQRDDWYELDLPDEALVPCTFAAIQQSQELVTELIVRYIESTWKHNRRKWESLNTQLDNFRPERAVTAYEIKVDKKQAAIIRSIHEFCRQVEHIEHYDPALKLGMLNVDMHAYQPLLYTRSTPHESIRVMPVPLNQGETEFVRTLQRVCEVGSIAPAAESTAPDAAFPAAQSPQVYLVRNLSRGHGISLFNDYNFHPDFILWMKYNGQQHIIFIDPKGLMHLNKGSRRKIEMHTKIKDIERQLQQADQYTDIMGSPRIYLHSYIWSITRREEISTPEEWSIDEWHQRGVYFAADGDHSGEMRSMLLHALSAGSD